MKSHIALIFAIIVEVLLLILILLVIAVGILGVFFPFLPGLFLIGAGAGLYSLLARGGKGRLTPFIDRYVASTGGKLMELSIVKKTMNILSSIKGRNKKSIHEVILSHGLILCGYNFALALGLLFGFTTVSIIAHWIDNDMTSAMLSMATIFIFSAVSAVVWYRFGQVLGSHLKQRRAVNAALVVLVSILPLLAILIMFAAAVGVAGGFGNQLIAIFFLALLTISILASAFELIIVSAGVLGKR